MLVNNLNYWERRSAQQMYEYMEDAEKTARELGQAYQKLSIWVQREAEKIFQKFQGKYGLTQKEAEILLKQLKYPADIEELKRLLKQDPKNVDLLKELESQVYGARINNLSNLQAQLDTLVLSMFSAEQKRTQTLYKQIAKEAYYKSIFNIQQYVGYNFEFKTLDEKIVRKVLQSKWYGKNYSTRIWNNTHALAKALKEELLISLLTGRPLKDAQEAINDKFAAGYDNARRLVRTESCSVANQMQLESYKACGVKKYIYVAILDLKTSKICKALDKKRFLIEDAVPGKNYPPMHPWCRSTTIADMPNEWLHKMKQSAIDPSTGKRITVPGDMAYQEWYDKYVAGKDILEADSRVRNNQSLDKTQHEKYRGIFGDEIPDNLDKFKDLKYNNSEKWRRLKVIKQERLNEMDFADMKGLVGKLGDLEARSWYKAHDKRIPELIDKSLSLEGQARQACNLRNQHRTQTRDLMKDQKKRAQLDIDEPNKSFEQLLKAKMSKGLSREDVYKAIIKSATKTRKSVDEKYGLED